MKKIALILLVTLSFSTFAQKSEVKAAEKLFKNGKTAEAITMIDKACKLKDQADEKTKARILFNKGKIYAKKGTEDVKYFEIASKTLNDLKAFEKEIGKNRYSDDADKVLASILDQLRKQSFAKYNAKDYINAAKLFDLEHQLTKENYFKYAAADSYLRAKKYKESLQRYNDLYNSGYTGVFTKHTVKNVETGKREDAGSATNAKLLAKSDKYTDYKEEKTPSVRPDIISNILFIDNELNLEKEALEMIQKAQKEFPNNIDFIIAEGNYYLKKGDNKKFEAAMQKAISLDPNNKIYNFNLGTAYYQMKNYDKAKKYFEKTIELDPTYIAAYKGLSYAILAPDKKITDELNKDSVLANDKLYEKYMNQHQELFRKALPILEKAYELDSNDIEIVQSLKIAYQELDMNNKAKELKAKLKELRSK